MADELLYLLKVANSPSLHDSLISYLGVVEVPTYVRMAVHTAISNYGYGGYEGQILSLTSVGLLIGRENPGAVPRLFVPWNNIAYLADGTLLAASLAQAGSAPTEEAR